MYQNAKKDRAVAGIESREARQRSAMALPSVSGHTEAGRGRCGVAPGRGDTRDGAVADGSVAAAGGPLPPRTADPNRFPDHAFVDTAVGGVHLRNNIVTTAEALIRGYGQREAYAGVFRYAESYRHFVGQNGTVKGYTGEAYADFLPLDIDVRDDLAAAQEGAIALGSALIQRLGAPAGDLRYFFSGMKGFHLLVPTELFGNVSPSVLLPQIWKGLATQIATEARTRIDPAIYDRNRLFRLPNTIHGESGLWKIELSWTDLCTLTPDEIRALARENRELPRAESEAHAVPALVEFYERVRDETNLESPLRRAGAPARANGSERSCVDGVAAVLRPHWTGGDRHNLALGFAGLCASSGVPLERVTSVLTELCGATQDRELDDRLRAARDTYDRVHSGDRIAGFSKLQDLLTEPDLESLQRALDDAPVQSWERPIAFDEYSLPRFPTDALPGWLREAVEATATATQTPPDLAAMLAVAICAAALAKRIEVQVRSGWREPVNLFVVCALPPGNRKSAVFSAMTAPFREFEKDEQRRLTPEIATAASRRKVAETALARAQNRAAAAEDPEASNASAQEAERLARDLAAMAVSVRPRLITEDASPEALASLLHEQGGRMAVLGAEGTVFELMAGRYSANGGPNFDVYLRGHAGDDLYVDRKGRAPEHVEKPALTMGLAVQPEVLRGLADKPGFHGKGLLARILYAVPPSTVGARIPDPPPVPEEVSESYRSGLLQLLQLPVAPEGGPHVLRLSPEAETRLKDFVVWLEPQLCEFGTLGGVVEWASKLAGGVVRIAGILHMADHAGNPTWLLPVGRETVERAIRIAEYLIPHAQAAHAQMGADPAVAQAQAVLRWIQKQGMLEISKRDIQHGMPGRFRRAAHLDPVLVLLVEHGYFRAVPVRAHPGPGRKPSPRYEVNPFALRSARQTGRADQGLGSTDGCVD